MAGKGDRDRTADHEGYERRYALYVRCDAFKDYKAYGPPRCECSACWGAWGQAPGHYYTWNKAECPHRFWNSETRTCIQCGISGEELSKQD